MTRENLIRRSHATTFEQRREMARNFMNSETSATNSEQANDTSHENQSEDNQLIVESVEQLLQENYEEVTKL